MFKTTRIHLIRHCEVVGHDQPRYNGQTDVAVTERGLEQYHRIKERLAACSISACFSSDLSRCAIGADIICERLDIKPRLLKELRELNIGVWEGLSWDEIKERWPTEWQARLDDMVNYRVPGGENLLDMEARVIPMLKDIVNRHEGDELLIVAHGGVNRIILLNAIGAPLCSVFNIEQNFCCHNIIDYYSDGLATVKLLNGQLS